jgi:phosphoenolpyruvate-protein phosphotransferase (PTS system enzyme I)
VIACAWKPGSLPGVDGETDLAELGRACAGKRVVLRTRRGRGQEVSFLNRAAEPNPASVHGLRTAWCWPEVLDLQLAAIAEAANDSTPQV